MEQDVKGWTREGEGYGPHASRLTLTCMHACTYSSTCACISISCMHTMSMCLNIVHTCHAYAARLRRSHLQHLLWEDGLNRRSMAHSACRSTSGLHEYTWSGILHNETMGELYNAGLATACMQSFEGQVAWVCMQQRNRQYTKHGPRASQGLKRLDVVRMHA